MSLNLQGLPTETTEVEDLPSNKFWVIFLSVLSGTLGALLVAFAVLYLMRTRSYKRQIKVLTDSNFGSNSEEINKNIQTLPALPNTNVFANEQSNNPGFKNIFKNNKEIDRQSIISSDSDDFAGIYDNPIFNISQKFDESGGNQNPLGKKKEEMDNENTSYI